MKKVISVVMVAMMAICMLAGCGKSKDAGAIKVGSIGPTTGDYAQYGLAVENAMKMAADEINALGGLQFEVLGEDDQGDPTMAVNAYNREMEKGMQALLGTVTSGACAAVAAEAYKERVFLLTPSASNPAVNEGKDNVYQVCFTDPNQGASAALTIKNLGLGTKIAIIWNNAQDYSTSIYQSFTAKAAEIGLDVVVKDATFSDDSNADFSVQLQKAADAGADLVFLPIYYTPVAAIMQQAKAAGYNFKFFGVDGMDGLLAIDGFDTSLAEGSYMLTPFDANKTDSKTTAFVSNYKAKFGDVPNQFAADAYDAMYIFYAACQDLGITAETSAKDVCEKMIPWMQKYTYTGLTGDNMVWGADGCVSKAATAYVIRNGQYASVQ
ncbi:MAG: ABC transporter substrate-binding protein [Lachnospiraceae bacterium]|nr:ABC transporter substrate-binding protein [Lachnospiraceae bacterium]